MTAAALPLAAVLLASAAPAGAAGKAYDDIRPLFGTWDVQRDCPDVKDRLVFVFTEEKDHVTGRILDAADPAKELGRFDIVYNGSEGHYKYALSWPENATFKGLGVDPVPGSLVVSDDTADEDSPGRDYFSFGSVTGPLKALATVKLRGSRRNKGTFTFKGESGGGRSACRGAGAKRKP